MSLYLDLTAKIAFLEKRIKEKETYDTLAPYLGPDIKLDHSFLRVPKFLRSLDHFELAIANILLKLVKIWMIVRGSSGSNFHIFTQAGRDGVYICNYTFCHYKTYNNKARNRTLATIILATTLVSLIVALIFPGKPIGHAATYNWMQSAWSTLTANYANHASNQSGWAEYSAKDAGISAGATVGLASSAGSYTETLDADFNDANLVGGWSMDEGSGSYINDSSGIGNVGTISIGATGTQTTTAQAWTNGASGKYAGALSFDGTDDHVSVPSSASLSLTSAITLSGWVYINVYPSTVGEIVAKYDGYSNNRAYLLDIDPTGKPRFYVSSDGVEDWGFTATNAVPLATWTHIVGTSDGTTMKIYVNGVQDAITKAAHTIFASASPVGIGGMAFVDHTADYFINARIDDVRIYNTALTQAQIQAVMENAKGKGDTYVSSGSVKLIIPPAQVTTLAAVSGNTQAVLTWTAPADNGGAIGGYKVYRGTTSGGETLLASGGCSGLGNVLTCTDTGLTNGTTYYYKATAVNATGEGSLASANESNITAGFINGVCSGIAVYYTDIVGTNDWGGTSACVAPYVSGPCGAEDSYLVDPSIYPEIDFSGYPAQNACKAIGARLPSKTQLACIYTNRAYFGTFQSNYYWSSVPYYGGSSAWAEHFGTGSVTMGSGTNNWYARCVK